MCLDDCDGFVSIFSMRDASIHRWMMADVSSARL